MITQNSRYAQSGLTTNYIFGVNAGPGSIPKRVDYVTFRRFTSWDRPENSFDHVALAGDTMATLADKYYGDEGKWWIIADFNPSILYPLDLVAGDVLVIPSPALMGKVESAL